MDRKTWILLFMVLVFGTIYGGMAAEECVTPVPCPGGNSICIYYFYGESCSHCARIKPLIDQVTTNYTRVQIYRFEVYYNSTNQALFRDFVARYEIIREGVPALFIGDRALVGEKAIQENLEGSIQYFYIHEPICPTTYQKKEGGPHDISPGYTVNLTVPAVVIAAAIDSINPCAFAVLIFLLVYLTSLHRQNRILIIGLTYIASVFTVYFFSGLGLFTIVQSTGITDIVFRIAAIIAVLAGIVNVKDFLFPGKGISLSIPESRKETIKKFVMRASIPSAIILGVLVSIFELPCTGGIYLAILGLLSSKMTLAEGIPYLVIYNIIFILPLIAILLFVHFGISVESMESWRGRRRRWMRLSMGLLMIILGVLMLYGFL